MKLHLLLVWLHSMEFHLSEPLATSSATAQQQSPPLLLLLLIRSLRLRRTPDGLGSVLALFPCLLYYQHSSNILNPVLPCPRLFLSIIHRLQASDNHHHDQQDPKGRPTLLPARLLDLCRLSIPHQPIMWFKLLHRLIRIVDEREACGLASTVLGAETEDRNGVFVGFVEFGEFGPELVFGDIWSGGVEDIAG